MDINWALLATLVLSIIVMIGLPVLLSLLVIRHFKVSWWVIVAGVLTFVGSQVIHIPALTGVNALLSNGTLPIPSSTWQPLYFGVLTGLLAGLCEEGARWVGFKILRKKASHFGSSLALGVGHGGAESIILCVLGTAWSLVTVLTYNAGGQIASGVSTDTVQTMLAQISAFWAQPWYTGLLPGLERIIALSTQILLSIMVWKAVVNRSFVWWLLAVLYHTVVDAVSVFLTQIGWGDYQIEGILLIFLVLNVLLIHRFYLDESVAEEEEEAEEDEESNEGDETVVIEGAQSAENSVDEKPADSTEAEPGSANEDPSENK